MFFADFFDFLNSRCLQNVYLTFAVALLCCFGGLSAFFRDVTCCGSLSLSCSIIVLSHISFLSAFMFCRVAFVDAFFCVVVARQWICSAPNLSCFAAIASSFNRVPKYMLHS